MNVQQKDVMCSCICNELDLLQRKADEIMYSTDYVVSLLKNLYRFGQKEEAKQYLKNCIKAVRQSVFDREEIKECISHFQVLEIYRAAEQRIA